MRVFMLAVVVVLALVGTAAAQAAGPVNPSQAIWVAPIVNADGSPLQDLSGYNVYIAGPLPLPFTTCPIFARPLYALKKSVPSLTSTPVPNATVTLGTAGSGNVAGDLGLTTDGQYCGAVTAVDLTLNEGAASNTGPFVRNKVAPGAPSGFQFLP